VGIEDARLRDRGEGERDDDLLAPSRVVAGKAEQVVEVGRADIDVGEDRIDGIGIVVVGHRKSSRFGSRARGCGRRRQAVVMREPAMRTAYTGPGGAQPRILWRKFS